MRAVSAALATAASAAVFVGSAAGVVLLPTIASVLASTVSVGNGPAQVSLQVGDAAATQSTVSFAVPALEVGNGVAVAGTPTAVGGTCPANSILVDAQARYQPPARTVQLTANSVAGLSGPGGIIPLTQITWTALTTQYSPVTLPSGAFNGTAAQLLASFQTSSQLRQCLTFTYLNSTIVGAGTYTGGVTYTLTML